MIILKIAFRNLWEHKLKSLIVGILIAFGSFILVAGNSFLDSVGAGMHQSYSANYTGDLIVHGQSKTRFSMMPGQPVEGGTPLVADYPAVQAKIDSLPQASQSLPMVGGLGTISVDDNMVGFSMLWAADYARYQKMFPGNLDLVAGSWPDDPEGTIVMSAKVHADAEKEAKRAIKIGDKLLLSGISGSGTKIREVTLAGVFRFKRGGEILDMISLVDPGTLRGLNGMTSLAASAPASPAPAKAPAAAVDEDALFGGGQLATPADTSAAAPENFDSLLGDTSVRAKYATTNPDAWNYLLIRLKDPAAADAVALELNQWFAQRGLALECSDWRWGAGQQAEIVNYLQLLFNIVVLIIVVVVVIIIMNTLVISITERIPEIGTMRAIGAGKSFVRAMILTETLIISAVFGLIGMLAGSATIGLFHVYGLAASNPFLGLLFGGAALHPDVSLSALSNALIAVLVTGVASCLYPIAVALKISPVRAMQR